MTAATSFAIPSPAVAAAFVDGELAVGPTSTAAGTSHLARLLNLAGGVYTLRMWAKDVATLWVGTELISTRRIGVSNIADAGPITVDVYAQPGTNRIDVTLVNLTAGQQPYFALSIVKDGKVIYTSAATGWEWGTSPVLDSALPSAGDPRLSLPVWTLTPNWKDGVLERLAWLTDVLVSEEDSEQRRALRRFPRRSIEASFLRANVGRMVLDTFVSALGRNQCLVPLWFEQLRTTAIIGPSTPSIAFPTGELATREFHDGDLFLLSDRDPAVYDLCTVASIAGDVLTIGNAPLRTWPVGTRITPLRTARIEGATSVQNITATIGSAQVRFELSDSEKNIAGSWGYCSPLWRFVIDRSTPMNADFDRLAYSFDVNTGVVDVVDPANKSRIGIKANLLLRGRAEVNAYKAFLAMARGKAARFWYPSGTHDLEPLNPIGGTTIIVRQVGYSRLFTSPQDARVMLAFIFTDGRPSVYRRIVATEDLGDGGEQLTLDAAVPPVDRAVISRLSYVLPVRFDQDSFELYHVTDDLKAVKAAVVVRSSEIAGMPPIDCWITSQPYPVQVNGDALAMSGEATNTAGIPPLFEPLAMGATILGGSFPLIVIYTPVSMDIDSLDMGATIIDGSFPLTVTYGTADAGVDSMDMTAAVTGGTMVVNLIQSVMDTDSLNISATIINGTLI